MKSISSNVLSRVRLPVGSVSLFDRFSCPLVITVGLVWSSVGLELVEAGAKKPPVTQEAEVETKDTVEIVVTVQAEAKAIAGAAAPAEVEPAEKKPADAAVKKNEAIAVEAVGEEVKPAEPPRILVRQKAAVVAAGAAVVVEEVGVVIGNILGGIFGGGGQVQAQNGQLDENVLKQFEQQYGRHFDQIVRTELHFIRVVCQPTRQQYESIASDSKSVRTKAVQEFAMIQQGMQRGQTGSDNSDTRRPVVEGLLVSVKRHLSPEQVADYDREVADRNAARKEVAVLVTAAKLDRKLVLNPEQRTQVTQLLNDNWNESWASAPMLMYGGEQFPNLPDPKLMPILTASQKKVWQTVAPRSQTH
ncbi:MAG: hypothetical protein O3B86_13640, partial [Planctomycetota bacterium]|nr:hypothetical protein [Planctomycetota bacterium]